MNTTGAAWLCAIGAAVAPATAQSITNGGFESGLTGWTKADQIGSDGSFFAQSGTASPVNGFVVPAPPQGMGAAMSDAMAGGTHLLYQDFVVPGSVAAGTRLAFSIFLNNMADAYHNPGHLDWAATNPNGELNLNQQMRVDIVRSSADPFSNAAADVLQNLFQTDAGTPLHMAYTVFEIDVTALLTAHPGETLRLRFAEVDNVNFLNAGVDGVGFTTAVPLPTALALSSGGLAVLALRRRRT